MKNKKYFRPKQQSKFQLDLQRKHFEAKNMVNKEEIVQYYAEFQSFMNWKNAPELRLPKKLCKPPLSDRIKTAEVF